MQTGSLIYSSNTDIWWALRLPEIYGYIWKYPIFIQKYANRIQCGCAYYFLYYCAGSWFQTVILDSTNSGITNHVWVKSPIEPLTSWGFWGSYIIRTKKLPHAQRSVYIRPCYVSLTHCYADVYILPCYVSLTHCYDDVYIYTALLRKPNTLLWRRIYIYGLVT